MAGVDLSLGGGAGFKLGLAEKLRGFEREVERFARATLNAGGRRFRARMVRERLSGFKQPRGKAPSGAPLAKKTGVLQRSLMYKPEKSGSGMSLTVSIGAGAAYYAERYEREGRLQFQRLLEQEARRIEEDLRYGFEAIARTAGQASGVVGAVSSAAGAGVEEAARISVLEGHFRARGLRRTAAPPKDAAALSLYERYAPKRSSGRVR
jgi:hypothetical protein